MGGLGSGCWIRYEKQVTTGACLSLSVKCLKTNGGLAPGLYELGWMSGEERVGGMALEISKFRVRLMYGIRRGNENTGENRNTIVPVIYTPCHFGGERPWWQCPQCGRRAAILYFKEGDVACRECHSIIHGSSQEGRVNRAYRRLNKVKSQLGKPWYFKPKGMHSRTFDRLVYRYREAEADVCGFLEADLGQIRRRYLPAKIPIDPKRHS